MKNLISASKLSFLSIAEYSHGDYNFFDAANSPRPHYCMALLTEGRAIFHDCESGEDIELSVGDVIFVAQGCRYTSEWFSEPRVRYVSIHFSFEHSGSFPRGGRFFLQKVRGELLPADIGESYREMLASFSDENRTFSTLEIFYRILGRVTPHLRFRAAATDTRITSAIEYIEQNYARQMAVSELAAHVNMSESRFFPRFHSALGVTPVEYINRYRVNRAILLLISDGELSIEDIAEQTGFESSAYFRRVFKRVTGMSPREYRRSAVEI